MGKQAVERCAAYGCAEVRANEVVDLCRAHQGDVNELMQWLNGTRRIIGGGGVMKVKPNDYRCDFDAARAQWSAGVGVPDQN